MPGCRCALKLDNWTTKSEVGCERRIRWGPKDTWRVREGTEVLRYPNYVSSKCRDLRFHAVPASRRRSVAGLCGVPQVATQTRLARNCRTCGTVAVRVALSPLQRGTGPLGCRRDRRVAATARTLYARGIGAKGVRWSRSQSS